MLNYAIVGGGRLARHFAHYFRLLEIPHTCWTRDNRSPFNSFDLPDTDQRLKQTLGNADRVLLLVADDAIAVLLKQHPFLHDYPLIHCSGALSLPGVAGAHPLMTFTEQLYGFDIYQKVPFVLEEGYSFNDLFPALPNPHFVIRTQDKARYHAMCVMAGNFSQLLWKGIAERLEQQFEWPSEILAPYLQQLATNFIQAPESALTGPLVRKDQLTLERNIKALDGDPLQDLYQAFLRFYASSEVQGQLSQQTQMEKTA